MCCNDRGFRSFQLQWISMKACDFITNFDVYCDSVVQKLQNKLLYVIPINKMRSHILAAACQSFTACVKMCEDV